jgi:hypothetical protein
VSRRNGETERTRRAESLEPTSTGGSWQVADGSRQLVDGRDKGTRRLGDKVKRRNGESVNRGDGERKAGSGQEAAVGSSSQLVEKSIGGYQRQGDKDTQGQGNGGERTRRRNKEWENGDAEMGIKQFSTPGRKKASSRGPLASWAA